MSENLVNAANLVAKKTTMKTPVEDKNLKTQESLKTEALKEQESLQNKFLTNIIFEQDNIVAREKILAEGKNFKNNTVVVGKVVEITNDFVAIDIKHKSIGLIPKDQFIDPQGEFTAEVGKEEKVYLERLEDAEGQIKLSKKKYIMLEVWDKVHNIYENEGTISGTIIEKTKGGMKVDIGVVAFLPNSQIDLKPVLNLSSIIGKIYDFKILKYNKKKANIVLSRRALLEIDRFTKRSETIKKIKEGAITKGVVKNIMPYGVFVDIGGIDGLLHITDMTWGRTAHPSSICKLGDEIEVVILKLDLEKNKVALGLKQKTEDPWNDISDLHVDDIIHGKVINSESYGIFIEIKPGIEGLIHTSQISWSKTETVKTEQLRKIGSTVKAIIKEINQENRRISLSIKELEPNIWQETDKKLKKGDTVDVVINSIVEYGIFVTLDEGIEGLIHNSDISWNTRSLDFQTIYQPGDRLQAKVRVLEVDNERLALSIKHLTYNPWLDIESKIGVGDIIEAKIVFIENYGIFLEIYGVEGLLHHNKLSPELNTKKKLEEKYTIGNSMNVKVLKLNVKDHKLAFSLPKATKAIEKIAEIKLNAIDDKNAEILDTKTNPPTTNNEEGINKTDKTT